jgi:hypothetical protein
MVGELGVVDGGLLGDCCVWEVVFVFGGVLVDMIFQGECSGSYVDLGLCAPSLVVGFFGMVMIWVVLRVGECWWSVIDWDW